MTKELKIIEALGRHEDEASIDVLEDLGTNSSREDVREETAKALVRKNNEKALRIVVANKGKGCASSKHILLWGYILLLAYGEFDTLVSAIVMSEFL